LAGGYSDYELFQSGAFTAKQLKLAGCDIQRLILMTFFHAMQGNFWKNNTNWGSNRHLGEWYGVTLDGKGLVTKIDLRSNFLRGDLIYDLTRPY
jgi:hypothetical protein